MKLQRSDREGERGTVFTLRQLLCCDVLLIFKGLKGPWPGSVYCYCYDYVVILVMCFTIFFGLSTLSSKLVRPDPL